MVMLGVFHSYTTIVFRGSIRTAHALEYGSSSISDFRTARTPDTRMFALLVLPVLAVFRPPSVMLNTSRYSQHFDGR